MTARTSSRQQRKSVVPMHHDVALWFQTAGRVGGGAALLLFGVLAVVKGPPQSLEEREWEVIAEWAILGMLFGAYMMTYLSERFGVALLLIGGVALGVVASIRYEPPIALLSALAFVLPAIGFALHWQWHAGLRHLIVLTGVVAVILMAGGIASSRVYDYYYGPSHIASGAELPPVDLVRWVWMGDLRTDGFTLKGRLAESGSETELLVSTRRDLRDAKAFAAASIDPEDGTLVSFEVSGLSSSTRYWYAVRVGDGIDSGRRGSVRTLGEGPQSFTIAVGSCIQTGSNGKVFDRINEANPLFFVISGDFVYEDFNTLDPRRFLAGYERNLQAPAQQALYLDTPVVYTWDDHDFGGNDSDSSARARPAALTAYRAYVPHYELATSDGPIYHAFSAGRVRFIVTDTRAARVPGSSGQPGTMLGSEQKEWLKRELLEANGRYPLIVWVNSVPWIAEAAPGADHWGGYPEERRELADFIVENNIRGIAMLSGDAHMIAIDDGSNSNYASTGDAGFPVLHSAALDRRPSIKGGPYSEGVYPGGGQFALMHIGDDGGPTIAVEWVGMDFLGEEIVRFKFVSGGE